MPVTSELLSFILSLLGDPSKAESFSSDPEGALAVAGLSGVSCADVDAIAPLIANSAPGAVAIASVGGSAAPAEMIQHLVKNIAVSTFDNSGVIQSIWADGDVRQAFASDGGLALGGDLFTNDPIVVGDGNLVASDGAHAAGRDIIQNQSDGNLVLGGDQTIAQDGGVVAGGDALAAGDKVGGNNNEAENTGNDNSVSVGGNQNNAGNTGNDNSVSVGGNQNNAENTGNATVHDESVTIGDIAVDLSDRSDNSTSVGGNQNNAENTGNATIHDESVTVGDVGLDMSQDNSTGGDRWESGSNTGGIGNTDNRNSGNTNDSGNTVVLTETDDHSINVGTVAVDLSQDNSSTTGDTITDNSNTTGDTVDDHSLTIGDVDLSDRSDNSVTVGDVDLSTDTTVVDVDVDTTYTDDSITVGDIDLSQEYAPVSGDTVDATYTYDDSSVGGNVYESGGGSSYGDYNEQGSGNTTTEVDVDTTVVSNDFDYTWGE